MDGVVQLGEPRLSAAGRMQQLQALEEQNPQGLGAGALPSPEVALAGSRGLQALQVYQPSICPYSLFLELTVQPQICLY